MNFLKIGQAQDLKGKNKIIYRLLEIFPGFLSWSTLIILSILSTTKPVFVSFFIIAFDVYWLLLVIYLGIHLITAYIELKRNSKIEWEKKCIEIQKNPIKNTLSEKFSFKDIVQVIILPTSYESSEIIIPTIEALQSDKFPKKNMIVVLAIEERTGEDGIKRAKKIKEKFKNSFRNFLITIHPDNLSGEMKGKGANQTWAAKELKKKIIDSEKINYEKILISVFDIDTIIKPGYFFCLTYKFLTVENPYNASYQPIPFYYNNIWQAPFFARVAATSNTFWQMMQQIRYEKLATYSSHSMTWKALIDVDFWATNMVSEDSRIFWHCFLHYNGEYRVEPLHFPISMDTTMCENTYTTFKSLYKQQRRWGWGVENLPYLIFNFLKKYKKISKRKIIPKILTQIYGFHSWATNSLIIGFIGWLPIFFGNKEFHNMVISSNLPQVSRTLMILAMLGMILSAIISTLLLPKRPKKYGFLKSLLMIFQWLILPISIIIFGAFPALEAQTRLMINKRLGFQVTPKSRGGKEKNKIKKNNWDQK